MEWRREYGNVTFTAVLPLLTMGFIVVALSPCLTSNLQFY